MSLQHPQQQKVVLLPVFRPGAPLRDLVTALPAEGFDPARIVVVDDGSGPDAEPVLAVLRLLGCTVLQHPVNRGKGVSLKTGFRHAMTAHPGLDVVRALESLPDMYREVIQLRDMEQLTIAEAADRLGITREACKSRIHRGRALIREYLQGDESRGGKK